MDNFEKYIKSKINYVTKKNMYMINSLVFLKY